MTSSFAKRDKLRCTWTFWQDAWRAEESGETRQYLEHIGDADRVKDFYVMLNRHSIATIPPNASLHIFRKHVRPEWEDKNNINGGHLRVFSNIQPGEKPEVATKRLSCLWFDVLRSVIGEHFQCSEHIVGVGFTNKPHRPIMSLWLSTTEAAATVSIRNDMFQLCSLGGAHLFTSRFYSHRSLATASATSTVSAGPEVLWHRRIQSAPMGPNLSVDSDEDECTASRGSTLEHTSSYRGGYTADRSPMRHSRSLAEECSVTPPSQALDTFATAAVVGSSSFTIGGSSLECLSEGVSPQKTAVSPSTSNLSEPSPSGLLQRRGVHLNQSGPLLREHIRSLTDSNAAEAMTSQPIRVVGVHDGHCNVPTPDGSAAAAAGSVPIPSCAPTPVKDWTVDWSPSAFTAAQQSRSTTVAAGKAAAMATAPSFTNSVVPHQKPIGPIGPPKAVGVTPDSTMASAVRSGSLLYSPFGGIPPPAGNSTATQRPLPPPPPPLVEAEEPTRGSTSSCQIRPPLPIAPSPSLAAVVSGAMCSSSSATAAQKGVEVVTSAIPSKPLIVDPNQISDRKPFICRGTVYPPRMNRKDYRAVIFNQDSAPIQHPGCFAAPSGREDGDLTLEEFELLAKAAVSSA
eukprot:CAMPEP_0176407442 /NCGR_PEP_ID=MMETSP0127-20121128/1413_1 /TAXON_ID=938130 /ORGANISM="Platyophrya macrostoma, Strain WH" /LENGTH=625 /DNA_ID=CAMNT_0017786647 /DNA_START=90 /DNA_END=1967 /DNA_ORIENTATION=-